MTELIQDYLAAGAAATPDAPAIVLRDDVRTYGELWAHSGGLAALLRERGCEPGDRVAIISPKTPDAVVAMHAALRLGCPYVPIDIGSPAARVRLILEVAEPRVVLVAQEGSALAAELAGDADIVVLEDACRDALGREAPADEWRGTPADIAHLLFTSGSTGVPKGVTVLHRGVTHFIDWSARHLGIARGERVSNHSPHHFDLSTFDIYAALAAGAAVHIVPSELNLAPNRLVEWIREIELNQWFSVPSVMNLVSAFDAIEPGSLPSLRRVMWCGEVLPTPTLRYWMERVPQATYTNLYGPTEATVASTWYQVDRLPEPDEDIPIGWPVEGEGILVVGDDLRELPAGEVGELCITGPGLSPGYWRDAEKTAAVFCADPNANGEGDARLYRTGDLARVDEEGRLRFLGRRDNQVKSRGYRIELGEIEAALATVEGLRESAVVGIETGGFEGTTLCGAFVSSEDGIDARVLRRELSERLPSYMIPSRWLALDVLPKNANGKIDRPHLRTLFLESTPGDRR